MSMKTHEDLHKELIHLLNQNETLYHVSNGFKELKTDYEKVLVSFLLLRDYDLLPCCFTSLDSTKSGKCSEKYRQDGNGTFVQKEDMLALHYYTLAVAFAPLDGKELPLALANRSAVTFSLGEYSDAIKDIDRALLYDYPEHLKYKLWERKGKSLIKLGKYKDGQEILETAIRALTESRLSREKCAALRDQLKSLIVECCQGNEPLTRENEDLSEDWPALLSGASPVISSGSSAISVEYTPEMGRCIVANTDISPGDILAIEEPYASVPLPSSYSFFCFHCHKRCHSLLPCLECSKVLYCDENCRQISWEESHCVECQLLPALIAMGCDKIELLALRVLIKASDKGTHLHSLAKSLDQLETFTDPSKKGFRDDKYLSNDYISVHNLQGNTDLRNVSNLFSRSVFASCILHVLDISSDFFNCSLTSSIEKDSSEIVKQLYQWESQSGIAWEKILTGGLLLKYMLSMGSNAHEISEMRIVPKGDGFKSESCGIGGGAYPLLSLINHSCDPNVVRHSHRGSLVVLSAIQIIRKGEQIVDNYGFHHATHLLEERQSSLQSRYYFTCQCLACTEDWPLYSQLPHTSPLYLPGVDLDNLHKMSKKFQEILEVLILNQTGEQLEEWLTFLNVYLKALQKSIHRPWKEFSECQEAIKQCLSCLKHANHYLFKSGPTLHLMNLKDIKHLIYY